MGGQLRVHEDGHPDPDVPGCWLRSGSLREPGPGLGGGQFQHCTDQVMIDEMHAVFFFTAAAVTRRHRKHGTHVTFSASRFNFVDFIWSFRH